MKKYSKLILFVLFICAGIFSMHILADAENSSDYYRERLEFDENGTLLMTTHDKKATSKITYRTIGWIIKRYDAPVTAEGQQYAVIKLRKYSDIKYRDDPKDSAYKYCYYYGDKDEIYDAIGKAGKGWQSQLYKYGDYIYIDEVMTVCVNGVPLGSLVSNSSNCVKAEGEVYFDYYGIVNARAWASPGSLLSHFNKRVKYPSMAKPPKFLIKEEIVDTVTYKNTPTAIGKIGHYEEGQEAYDLMKGVPSGENLYTKVSLDKAIYDIEFNRYLGNGYYPVKVITTYHLKWKDVNGNNRSEDFKAVRWYTVRRAFSYWTVDKCSYKYLSFGKINNYTLPNKGIQINSNYIPVISKSHKNGYKNHITMEDYTKTVSVDGGTVKGKNGLRPSIPNDDYSEVAEEQVGKYSVKNDKLVIDSTTILSNKKVVTRGTNPKTVTAKKIELYKSGNNITRTKENGNYESDGTAVYIDYDTEKKKIINIDSLNNVFIHTPVVCTANLTASREHNQEAVPTMPDGTIVIGQPFKVDISSKGEHKNIIGYRYADYSKYVGAKKIRFPFEVYYNNTRYSKNTWITIINNSEFILPVGVREGIYSIECITSAYNMPSGADVQKLSQQSANKDYSYYAARHMIDVKIIGSIHSYSVSSVNADSDKIYTVGDKNYKAQANNSKYLMPMEIKREKISFNVKTIGDYTPNLSLEMKLGFFYIKNGVRHEVDIYRKSKNKYRKISDTILLGNKKFSYIGQEFSYKVSDADDAEKGAQKWTGEIDMSGTLIILPKGKYADEVVYEYVLQDVLKGGNLIINSDIYTRMNNKRILTYIKGICNMWKREGFNYKNIFIDGDCLVTDMDIIIKNDYNIVGTH